MTNETPKTTKQRPNMATNRLKSNQNDVYKPCKSFHMHSQGKQIHTLIFFQQRKGKNQLSLPKFRCFFTVTYPKSMSQCQCVTDNCCMSEKLDVLFIPRRFHIELRNYLKGIK